MRVLLNHEQEMYVFDLGHGFSCLGFENLFKEAAALSTRLGLPELAPSDDEFGTMAALEKRDQLLKEAAKSELGTWFNPDTPKKVRAILEKARKNGTRLRLFFGDAQTGRDWLSEHDVLGRIGRSMGTLKIPLLIEEEGGIGGGGILDSNVIRIIDVETGRELYRHRGYHQPEFLITKAACGELPVSVKADGETHARFETMGQAAHWVAFMTGEIHEPLTRR
ncbi:hypothetical protein [Thioalkalivibrio thiocyanodenitrificans]|uniref:hypothetical protein n=1 Tax=Thioalkalivibrio thiocyanodenitrificans TaxID=243063 RepID=UPI00037FC269|nr:hypothetical protein [Thioalkalivibrio thiocyanodenitrificans]